MNDEETDADEQSVAYIWVTDDPNGYTWAVRQSRWCTDYEEAGL